MSLSKTTYLHVFTKYYLILRLKHGTPLALDRVIIGIQPMIGGFMLKAINLQTTLKLALCFIAIATIVSCGSSKSSDGFGSNDSTSTTPVATNESLAYCSQDIAANSELKVQVMQYVDIYGQAHADILRLKFLKIPSGWKISDWDLVLKRWAVSPDNKSTIDDSPLHFQFEKRTASGFSLIHQSDYSYQMFNYKEVEQMATYSNINESSFFSNVSLLVSLKGDSTSYQALRVQFSQDANGAVETYVDLLIPTFLADPAKYNADTRHPATLQFLHPMKDKLGQAWSASQYQDFAKSFCF